MQHKNERILRMLELVTCGSNNCKPGGSLVLKNKKHFITVFNRDFDTGYRQNQTLKGLLKSIKLFLFLTKFQIT